VQDRVGGGAREVGNHAAGPSGWRTVATAVPLDVRTAYSEKPSRRGATPEATGPSADPATEPIAVTRYDRDGGRGSMPVCSNSAAVASTQAREAAR